MNYGRTCPCTIVFVEGQVSKEIIGVGLVFLFIFTCTTIVLSTKLVPSTTLVFSPLWMKLHSARRDRIFTKENQQDLMKNQTLHVVIWTTTIFH